MKIFNYLFFFTTLNLFAPQDPQDNKIHEKTHNYSASSDEEEKRAKKRFMEEQRMREHRLAQSSECSPEDEMEYQKAYTFILETINPFINGPYENYTEEPIDLGKYGIPRLLDASSSEFIKKFANIRGLTLREAENLLNQFVGFLSKHDFSTDSFLLNQKTTKDLKSNLNFINEYSLIKGLKNFCPSELSFYFAIGKVVVKKLENFDKNE